jgi:hypothetical protein
MSLVNVYMEHDRALIGFDTLSSAMEAPPVAGVDAALARFKTGLHMSKCTFLAHANVAIAHRGDAMLAVGVCSAVQLNALPDFDAMTEAMPQLLAQSHAQVTAFRKQQMGIDGFPGAEIILVGWSRALNRMEGVRWLRWPTDKGFSASPVGKALMLPDAEWPQTPDAPDTAEKMEAIARDQVAYVRREHAGYNCGGRLLLAELTRDTLNVHTIADLESPQSVSG